MGKIKTTFESFLNEGTDADNVQNLLDAKTAALELVNLSGELLSPQEFGEYLESYYEDPTGSNIDPESKYYAAIVSAYEDISNEARSPKWQSTDVEKSDFYNEYEKVFLRSENSRLKKNKDDHDFYSSIKPGNIPPPNF